MTLKQLNALVASGASPQVEVHAIDPMVYLVFRVTGERREPVDSPGGAGRPFRSRYAATQALAEAGIERITFIHRSAYGEMIGMEGSSEHSELRETVVLRPDQARSQR